MTTARPRKPEERHSSDRKSDFDLTHQVYICGIMVHIGVAGLQLKGELAQMVERSLSM